MKIFSRAAGISHGRQMKFRSFVIVLVVALVNAALWIGANQPINPDSSSYPFMGLSYNPYQRDQDPIDNPTLQREAIAKDLELLSTKTKSIRIYNSLGFEEIPNLARMVGLSVVGSAWLDGDSEKNALEVEAGIRLAGRHHTIKRLIIGNETQLKKTVSSAELEGYLDEARKRLRTPVSTAEPWDFWINNPEFADKVDFIAIHILPYWMEIPIEQAVDYTVGKYLAVKERFPHKFVMISETGWPSDGPQRGAAEATLANQARFVREFVARANKEGIAYNVIEAFDQPWKSSFEGRAGEHFGIMDADRRDKFPLTGIVLEDPNWELWAISSLVIGMVSMGLFLARRPQLGIRGKLFSAIVIQAAASSAVQLAREASDQYMSPGDIAFWSLMLLAQSLLAIIFLADAAEIADVVGRRPLRRAFPPARRRDDSMYPLVSLHLACCREPPAMVIQTIESLSRLDYPRLEVIVVDNNTPDESLWRPVEKRCAELGSRFRFFSLGKWPGYKSGALNFALKQTDPRAEIVGVIDADYVVEPHWLSGAVPYFDDHTVAVVQAPQEHRSFEQSLFQMMENDEYSGFFRIGMVQRNEDNAIIQHGTMTLIRRADLDALGGWAEWCICEDAELGLRLLCSGKTAVYIDHAFGHGLVPDSYTAYSKQRFRWAYGGMRIMRRYWRELLGLRQGLNRAQRYQFIKGWLPWIGDALHMFFTATALLWSAMLMVDPLNTDFPEPIFIYPALALVALRIFGTAWTYATRVRIGSHRTLLAMIAGGSLTHTVGKAVFLGLFTSSTPFHRTPKMANAPQFVQSLAAVYQELLLAVALLASSVGIIGVFGIVNDTAVLWSIALAIQSLPYLAAITASIVSSVPTKPRGVTPPKLGSPPIKREVFSSERAAA